METSRQRKVAELLQEDFAEIFRKQAKDMPGGILITVTHVKVSPDLSVAKIYLSIFPSEHREKLVKEITEHTAFYRNQLGRSLGKHLRIIPQLSFYSDDTLDYLDKIDRDLKGHAENPLYLPQNNRRKK